MPGYLAGPLSIPAGQPRHAWFSLREFIVVLIIVAVIVILLAGPVVAGALYEALSRAGERAAPGTFFLGLGILFVGIIVGVRIIDFVGLGLIGAVVIGVIIDNYLGALAPRERAQRRDDLLWAAAGIDRPASLAWPAAARRDWLACAVSPVARRGGPCAPHRPWNRSVRSTRCANGEPICW